MKLKDHDQLSVFWFRRDLRLEDNTGLYQALSGPNPVLPVFIFDTNILSRLQNKNDRRVEFILQCLHKLNAALQQAGSSLLVLHGDPLTELSKLCNSSPVRSVYCNHDYEPYAIKRDQAVEQFCIKNNLHFKSYKDQCIFEKSEIVKDNGEPYTVFTPYSRKWKKKFFESEFQSWPVAEKLKNLANHKSTGIPAIQDLGFMETGFDPPKLAVSDVLLKNYVLGRNFPAQNGTSRLSVHLRFGTVSIRKLATKAATHSEAWLNELIWRDFYMMILWHFPYVEQSAFKKEYNRIAWRNNEKEFKTWCEGNTGFPMVDAGMRELNATGFMHNRVRMITSSFLVKDLLIDWRWGEAYFAEKLNDFDLSANNGGWQWAAGSGCDAAPYFRIFNPAEQQKKFDPDHEYIKKWIPEFGSSAYPQPMVDHAAARIRALTVYKEALNQAKL